MRPLGVYIYPMSGAQVFFAVAALAVALASLLMRMASTPPKTAASNLSEWAKTLHLPDIPPWLLDKNADDVAETWARRVRMVGVFVLILSGAVWFWTPQTKVVAP